MTSTAVLLTGAAMFQRKSRAGWLDELAGIRHDALAVPGGEMAVVMSVASGDMGAPARSSDGEGSSWSPSAPPAAEAPAPAPAPTELSGPIPYDQGAVVVHARDITDAPPVDARPPAPGPGSAGPPSRIDAAEDTTADDWWAQPAPHPIRPSEMWHPATAPGALSRDGDPSREQRIESSDLTPGSGRFAQFRPAATEAQAEAAAAAPAARPAPAPVAPPAPAPVAPIAEAPRGSAAPAAPPHRPAQTLAGGLPVRDPSAPNASSAADPASTHARSERPTGPGGLVSGPVGRRPRPDRPRPSLPLAPIRSRDLREPEERSPLPEAPLPPAAPPARHLDLGEALATPAPAADEREAEAEVERPTDVVPVGALDTHRPALPEPLPVTEAQPLPPRLIERSATGELDVEAPIVRLSEEAEARTTGTFEGVDVTLAAGWCWVAPAAGRVALPVRIHIPTATLTFGDGSSGLAVVEADGTTFLVVAAGTADLSRGADRLSLVTGSMVLLPHGGRPQIDRAGEDEIAADPIVARNRALDASR